MTSMPEHPFKPILLDLLQQASEDQETFVRDLSESERSAVGTPDHWAAKDHLAHMNFWREHINTRLATIIAGQTPPPSEPFLTLNEQVFAQRRDIPWTDVLDASRQSGKLLAEVIGQLAEEDLVGWNRFEWQSNQNPASPLYGEILGNTYEHARDHFAQYLVDRGDLEGATRMVELWTERFVATDAPDGAKGILLYNQACFYATHGQLEKAGAPLEQALQLDPQLVEWSMTDPDLVDLREGTPPHG